VVEGIVNADGSVNTGTGYTVTVLGPGRYQLNFTTPFKGVPTVLVTNVYGSIGVDAGAGVQPAQNAVVDQATAGFALVATGDANGVPSAESFGFMALTKP
jgi:hypothetical protein